MIQLKILKGPQKVGEEYGLKLGTPLILGRATECDIQLLSFGISKQHCKLTALPGGKLEVEDLGSSNGTFINGIQVQKRIVKPGDSLGLSDFLFQIQWAVEAGHNPGPFMGIPQLEGAPQVQNLNDQHSFKQNPFGNSAAINTTSSKLDSPRESGGLQATFASWIDPIAESFPIHKLIFLGFMVWTLLTVLLSVFPFSNSANERIRENSIQTAKLYARQLARVNQKAIIEQRISDIVSTLDERPGLTRGVLKSYVLDAQKGRIMAPTNEAGNTLPNNSAVIATQQDKEWHIFDQQEQLAYISAPVLVGTPEGNLTAATAFVIYDPTKDVFSVSNILESALTSLIFLLVFSLVAVFTYQRFVIIPVQRLGRALEKAVAQGTPFEGLRTGWSDLSEIGEKISTLVSRLPKGSSSQNEAAQDWSIRVASEIGLAAAAFDSSLKIIEWSDAMGQLTGVRREYAVGSDLGVASRDMAFEGSVRELCSLAQNAAWSPQNKTLDFQGMSYVMSMIYGSESYLLLIRKEDLS